MPLEVELAAVSAKDLTIASTSSAAFFRFSYDRSPNARWTSGGRGDSELRLLGFTVNGKDVGVAPVEMLPAEVCFIDTDTFDGR